MSSSQKAKIALASALVFLFIGATAAGAAIFRLHQAETLVRHTYEIEVAIGDLEASLTDIGRTRVAYINSGASESLKSFSDAVNSVGPAVDRIRRLTVDNPTQQALCDRLVLIVNQRVAVSQQSVALKQQNKSDPQTQFQLASEAAKAAFDTGVISQQMRGNEDRLLDQRSRLSNLLFTAILGILAVSFLLSVCMFWLHYWLLNREVHERRAAENQLRQLSVQLMRVQDEEHRRFARELHDGLGQTLAAAKMMVEFSPDGVPENPKAVELAALLGDAISQTRTISHLFHPPLLDEIGFPSAARWLIKGYTDRTGMVVTANIPDTEDRLPRNLELALYRVLQEALNNIHRHSKSANAEVSLLTDANCVTLRVKDDGHGIPSDTLSAFQENRTQAGVGLLSMKERVREQSGQLEIRSHAAGTEIVVTIPYQSSVESTDSVTA